MQILKIFIVVVCFVLFCYQIKTATMSLMNPPMVDSSYERDITDDDLPLVTVCPTNQINLYGNLNLLDVLYGKLNVPFDFNTSWGGHVNLTFKELITDVFDLKRINAVKSGGGNFTNELVFIPAYGLCKEFSKISQGMFVYDDYLDEFRVLLTDKESRSFIMPDILSHTGSHILRKPTQELYIDVKIKVDSECNKERQPMNRLDYEKYEEY